MTEEQQKQLEKLNQEKNELNRLINAGISFEIEVEEVEIKRKLYFFKRREIVTRKQRFTIAEPTLGTLDRIASESINFAITDAEMQSVDSLSVGMQKVHKNVEKCAKIVAYAVMGSEYEAPQLTKDGRLVIRPDIERFHELTRLFIRKLKPSSLYRLAQLIQLICNLGDFTNSIRLLQSDRTTMPSRIED